jgi:hypothetical protein
MQSKDEEEAQGLRSAHEAAAQQAAAAGMQATATVAKSDRMRAAAEKGAVAAAEQALSAMAAEDAARVEAAAGKRDAEQAQAHFAALSRFAWPPTDKLESNA